MTVVLWLVALLPIASWITAAVLVSAALVKPHIAFLSAVAAASVIGALGGTLLAPLAIARLANLTFAAPWSAILLVTAVLLFSLPGPAFLAVYLLGWFDVDGDPPGSHP